jgi:uncharacterized protein (UPF0332 family)
MAGKINLEFQKSLEKKRILHFSKSKALIKKELGAAKDDLNEAKDRLKNKKYKYATITAYYSMFHAARALIYSKGYREKSHYYLLVALQALFVDKGLIEEELAKDFHTAMVLRESADYHGEFSKEGAESSIESATKFLRKAGAILN